MSSPNHAELRSSLQVLTSYVTERYKKDVLQSVQKEPWA